MLHVRRVRLDGPDGGSTPGAQRSVEPEFRLGRSRHARVPRPERPRYLRDPTEFCGHSTCSPGHWRNGPCEQYGTRSHRVVTCATRGTEFGEKGQSARWRRRREDGPACSSGTAGVRSRSSWSPFAPDSILPWDDCIGQRPATPLLSGQRSARQRLNSETGALRRSTVPHPACITTISRSSVTFVMRGGGTAATRSLRTRWDSSAEE